MENVNLENLATKDDFNNLSVQIKDISQRVDGISQRVDGMDKKINNLTDKVLNLDTKIDNVKNDLQDQMTEKFDRVVSIEMFEHMRNYKELLTRIGHWLRDDGKLFVHIFCHVDFCYPYEVKDDTDWMSKYFFSGGIMPSYDIFEQFDTSLKLAKKWKVNGYHYHRTCEDWLLRMDSHRDEILEIFKKSYP